MTHYQVTLTISDSGKIAKLITSNGRTIGEFFVDGPLKEAAKNAVQNSVIEKGRVNIFRGEIIQLESNEYLDCENEIIGTKKRFETGHTDLIVAEDKLTEDLLNNREK